MNTVIQSQAQSHADRTRRWSRTQRAARCEQYLALHAQGLSLRQAAKVLEVPRSTLQAWRVYQESLDDHPAVVAFFHSSPGLAFLHRLVLGRHLVCTEVGACGIRLVCLLLTLTRLDRFVAASDGIQHQINRQVEEAMVTYRHEESAHVAKGMPARDITLAQDETFTGGLCLVVAEPKSNDIVLAQAAQGRAQDTWQALMTKALAGLNCHVMQSTSDEAPGLLAYVEHHLSAHHSPDVFHGQHALVKAVSGPLATKQRAAAKAAHETQERLAQVPGHLREAGEAPDKRGPGRPPHAAASLEQLEQEAHVARHELERLSAQREQVAQSIRTIGQVYHVVDVERGVRRNGRLIAADIHTQIDTIRRVAQHEGLRQTGLERLDKAERVVPQMQATIEFVSRYVPQQVRQLDLSPPVSYALHAPLLPACYLERVARVARCKPVSHCGSWLSACARRCSNPVGPWPSEARHSTVSSPTRSKSWPRCSSVRVPIMWKGETATSP